MAKKKVPYGRGLERTLGPKARFDRNFKRVEQLVARDPEFRAGAAGAERRQSFPKRVLASQGFPDRRVNPQRITTARPRRAAAPRRAQAVPRAVSGIGKALRVSPIALGAAALLQPRELGDATRGTPMNSPAEVKRILAERRRRKARRIPSGVVRGLR
jgi:hypothetical protein